MHVKIYNNIYFTKMTTSAGRTFYKQYTYGNNILMEKRHLKKRVYKILLDGYNTPPPYINLHAYIFDDHVNVQV